MVERLKIAIEKARAQRRLADPDGAATPRASRPQPLDRASELTSSAPADPSAETVRRESAWNALTPLSVNEAHLESRRIISSRKEDPAHVVFDVLRTRMLGALDSHGWRRVGITSPREGCGKTFVASNLAFSLARQSDCRTVLMDMDLRKPSVADVLGIDHQESLRWFLNGQIGAEKYLRRIGANLAVGLNSGPVQDPAEVILAPSTEHAIGAMNDQFRPNVTIYDLPPMLAFDDVTGMLPRLDCILLVIGGGKTKPADVSECEHLLKDRCPLLGVVMNNADDADVSSYKYYTA